jgi:segregation and condensation protein B
MDRFQQIRLIEAIIFASTEPIAERVLVSHLPEGANVGDLLEELRGMYENRGVNLIRIGNAVAFRTAADLTSLMKIEREVVRKLSRAAVETLSIIAYHQPITRAEIEEVRGVSLSKGTIDILLEAGWVKPKGRRRLPGRPVTWGTTEGFLDHFGLETLDALPGVDELKAAGLLDRRRGFGPLAEQLGIAEDGVDRDDEDDDEEEIDITAIDAEFEDGSEEETEEISEDVQAN